VITVEETSSLVMFQTAVQSYMSLYQDSISPEALFRSQLQSTIKAVHQQFSSTFLEEVQLIVRKLRNDVPLTREESHKVDLYRTVCNAYRVQRWNYDISSSAPYNNTDTIVHHGTQITRDKVSDDVHPVIIDNNNHSVVDDVQCFHESMTTHQVQLHDSVSPKRKLMPDHDEGALQPTRKSPRCHKVITPTVTAAEQLSPSNVDELYQHASEAGEKVSHASEAGEDVSHECTPQSIGIGSTCRKGINPTTAVTIELSGEGAKNYHMLTNR
jgi:hypothetical protein